MKKECLELMDSLEESEKILKRLVKAGGVEDAVALLADMQQAAIAVGTQIEEREGEDSPAVAMLEEYCELLYRCSTDETWTEARQLLGGLGKLRRQIRKSIQEHVHEKREVVFFPYNASMWDSMESIWQAAEGNPDCQALVVPIPYYERNPDGSFGKLHYEGTQFPQNVPVFDWQSYHVEDRHPDVIVIHNPYDSNNYVTSVHPDFYAKRLTKYTKHLVYVPYSTGGLSVSRELCVNAGTIFADHVVVESKPALKCYQQSFEGAVLAGMADRGWEKQMLKKLLLLGSPKIDKAVSCRKEDYSLPEAWRTLLDGKRAVLYNISIGGLLAGNEQALKKLEDVLLFFQRQKKVVLWWRPHPLIEQTLSSMRPGLVGQYQKLVQWYRKENFGIYDDTKDLYRAIAFTDLHYGDSSSVVYLYGVRGKPILFQNQNYLLERRNTNREVTLFWGDCTGENGKLWGLEMYGSGVFEMELESGQVKKLGELPDPENTRLSLYKRIFHSGGSLWIVPRRAVGVFQYNQQEGRFIRRPLPGAQAELRYALLDGGKLYIITADYGRLITVDTQTGNSTMEPLKLPKRPEWEIGLHWFDLGPEICKVEHRLYFVIFQTNLLVEYDLRTKKTKLFSVGNPSNQYTHVVFDGDFFWLVPYVASSGTVVRWDRETERVWEINSYPEEFRQTDCWFRCVCFHKGYLWLFTALGNMSFKIEKTTMQMTVVDFRKADQEIDIARVVDDAIVLNHYRSGRNALIRLDADGVPLDERELVKSEDMQASERKMTPVYHDTFDTQAEYFLNESEFLHIQHLVDRLAEKDLTHSGEQACFQQLYANGDGTAGQKIVNHLLKLCGDG